MEQLALKLRRWWGIDNYSPVDIFPLVLEEIENLTLIWLDMDDAISGCCSQNDDDSLIVINSNHTKGRQNFTLAHELYHLKFDKSKEWSICRKNSKNSVELKANDFASHFLMPTCALEDYADKRKIGQWQLKDIIRCEQFFQISHQSMLIRLRNERYIDQDQFENFEFGARGVAASMGFDTALYEKSPESRMNYVLGNLIPLADDLYNQHLISKGLRNEILLKNYRADLVYNIKEDNGFD